MYRRTRRIRTRIIIRRTRIRTGKQIRNNEMIV